MKRRTCKGAVAMLGAKGVARRAWQMQGPAQLLLSVRLAAEDTLNTALKMMMIKCPVRDELEDEDVAAR